MEVHYGSRPCRNSLKKIALAEQLMGDRFKGCGWFIFVDLINVAILIAFSAIILIIPNTMKNLLGQPAFERTQVVLERVAFNWPHILLR